MTSSATAAGEVPDVFRHLLTVQQATVCGEHYASRCVKDASMR